MRITLNNQQIQTALKRYVSAMFNLGPDGKDHMIIEAFTRHHGGRVSVIIYIDRDEGEE